ncbi:chitin deacetylase [Podochytrium sp. JEL0797]|nr:chitin deacetylase [Podochytrium sp. JEL0797]
MSLNFAWAPAQYTKAPAVPVWTQYFQQANSNPPVPNDIFNCVYSAQKAWGASFDDGPSPYTSTLVDYLTQIGAQVTFYTVGSEAIDYPSAMQYAFSAGNEIQLHTWSHQDLPTLSDDEIVAELTYAAKAMYEIVGVVPRYFRPPYGRVDERVRRIAASMGLTSVKWSLDTNDWQYTDDAPGVMETEVMKEFTQWIQDGSVDEISLEHDIFQEAVEAGKKGMKLLKDNGYDVMTVAQCLGESPYANDMLRGFFESGQFDNKNSIVGGKPVVTTSFATTTEVGPTTTSAAPTTTSAVPPTTSAIVSTTTAAIASSESTTPTSSAIAPTTPISTTTSEVSISSVEVITSTTDDASTTETVPTATTLEAVPTTSILVTAGALPTVGLSAIALIAVLLL